MTIPTLGTLERVDLRETWPNEASSFTPWLAQEANLKALGRVIGLELELEAVEKSVGPFRADILCNAIDTDDHRVLIENQLETTDHKHLGQILTYLAGLDAKTVIWIASQITEQHRAAIDWLNAHTVGGVNFFAVEIEVWKIGESEKAPKFNLVSHPNDWTRSVANAAKNVANAENTEIQSQRFRFWTRLKDYQESNPGNVQPRNPSTHSGLGFALGRSGFRMSAHFNIRDGWVWVAVVIRGENRWDYCLKLLESRDSLQKELGFELVWPDVDDGIDAGKDVWITSSYKCDVADEQNWDEAARWIRDRLESIRSVFGPKISSL